MNEHWPAGKGIPVAVVACPDYMPKNVACALRRAFDLAGGLPALVPPGSRVLVKPNLLQAVPPERAVCTHPAVTGEVVRSLASQGCAVTVADSPGGGTRYTERNMERLYRVCGYAYLPEETGCILNHDCSYREMTFPGGSVCTRFPLIYPYFQADSIVSVSKAKTHVLTLMTGATKNLFGLLPGLEKPLFHSRFPDPAIFSDMLLDLLLAVQPALHIVDAIVAMEGDGPMSGSPRPLGAIVASPSALAADIVLCRLMGIDPALVPYLARASARGLIALDGSGIDIRGDPVSTLSREEFRMPGTYAAGKSGFSIPLAFRIVHRLGKVCQLRPVVDASRCSGCGKCTVACPSHAANLVHGRARIDRRQCIRCYCCHEMCEQGAIRLERGAVGALIHALAGEKRRGE
ncbi:MAG: DUF362 domain-containing protein [Methanolinea sp.]|jgi:uncharacterized protein (DUF362 family)/Pyruvate/2-oxoacid:ferredoxin oxidoreductase delta subunit|nr:DUF362 domain-containing protein [Methanolinea sp.]